MAKTRYSMRTSPLKKYGEYSLMRLWPPPTKPSVMFSHVYSPPPAVTISYISETRADPPHFQPSPSMPLAAEDQPVDSIMSQPPTAEETLRMKTKPSTTNGGASPPPPAAKRARTGKTETKDDQTKTNDDQTKTNDDQTTPPVQVLTSCRREFFSLRPN
jgi:hypothetical protein